MLARFVAFISKSAMPHHLAITLADLLSQCTCQFHGDADVQKEVRDDSTSPAAANRPAGKRAKRGTGDVFFFSRICFGAKTLKSHTEKPERTPRELRFWKPNKIGVQTSQKVPPKNQTVHVITTV